MMYVHLTFLQLSLLIITVTTTFGETLTPTRHDLENYLLKENDYDKNFPPNTENATDISVQLYITDFNSESDKEREIEFTVNLRMNWTDHRLDFNKNRTTFDVIPFDDDVVNYIWIPDLYFLQERKSLLHGLFKNNEMVYVFKNGSVFYSGRFNIKSHCVITLKKYPFDTQKCPIEIQSYALTTDYIILHWNGDKAVKIEPSMDPLKIEMSPQENSIETRYVYPEIGEFSMLKTEIVVPRPSGSYVTLVVVPPAMLIIVSMTSFCLSYDMNARIGIIIGPVTPLMVHWAGIFDRVSLDSTLDYLDYWMFGHLLAFVLILLVNLIMCCLKNISNGKKKTKQGHDSEEEEQIGIFFGCVSVIVVVIIFAIYLISAISICLAGWTK